MRIKSTGINLQALERFATSFSADYRFGPFNIMVLVGVCLAGLAAQLVVYPFRLQVVITMVGVALVLGVLLRLTQVWEGVVVLTTIAGLLVYLRHRPESAILVGAVVVAGLLAPSIQVAYQWEKAVLLRFGRFRGLAARACSCSSRWSTRCPTTSTSASG